MIEIAIAVGVIGFALVAIIGNLPRGMNVQKDNRESTIISQDAPYFLNAIRNGEMRTNNNILTSYVESITITNIGGPISNVVYINTNLTSGPNNVLTNDMNIIGLLSTPEFDIRPSFAGQSNGVTAIVHAMTGSAIQQNGANTNTAFRYQLTVEIDPWNYSWNPTGYTTPNYLPASITANPSTLAAYMSNMAAGLYEIRLKFAWPVFPNGSIGPGRQTYRSQISSHLSTNLFTNNPPLWFFQPKTFSPPNT